MIWRETGRPRLGYPPCSTVGSPPQKRRHEKFRKRRHEIFSKDESKYSKKHTKDILFTKLTTVMFFFLFLPTSFRGLAFSHTV
jgi:hypothetical protein